MIAIITARGGSKRIPNKNIKDFLGKPIIAYSIDAALKSKLFDKVMVSTDSKEIGDIAVKYGAEVPFMRSEKTSSDFASTRDVLEEVIEEYRKRDIVFNEFTCIYPTAPLITDKILQDSYNIFKKENADELIPVVKFSFPPQRSLVCRNGIVKPWDEISIKMRSQDLEPLYHDAGSFYHFKTQSFLNSKGVMLENTVPYILEEIYVQDIDNIEDWHIAELKYKYINLR